MTGRPFNGPRCIGVALYVVLAHLLDHDTDTQRTEPNVEKSGKGGRLTWPSPSLAEPIDLHQTSSRLRFVRLLFERRLTLAVRGSLP